MNLTEKNCLIQLVVLLGILLFVVAPFGTAVGLVAIRVKWFTVFLVFTCFVSFLILLIGSFVAKQAQHLLLRTAQCFLVALLVFWIGMLAFSIICGIATRVARYIVPSNIRLPLGEIVAIAVDGQGQLYCASSFYKRIQVYDSEGHFLKGWFVPNLAKYSNILTVDDQDNIHVATSISQRRGEVIFSPDGRIIAIKEKLYAPPKSLGVRSNLKCTDQEGNLYKLKYPLFFSKVIKINPAGKKTTLVRDPLNLWIVKASFPLFGFLVLNLVIIMVISVILRRI